LHEYAHASYSIVCVHRITGSGTPVVARVCTRQLFHRITGVLWCYENLANKERAVEEATVSLKNAPLRKSQFPYNGIPRVRGVCVLLKWEGRYVIVSSNTPTHTPPPHTGFPMIEHLSRLHLFQQHLWNLVRVWFWVWDWVHTSPHTLLHTIPFFSTPSFHTIPFLRVHLCVRDGRAN
jgi:hypothetical protein